VLNDAGDMVFIGDLTPAHDVLQSLGVFLNSKGTTTPVAPGDLLPGEILRLRFLRQQFFTTLETSPSSAD
jgi:hypothetical protein